MAISVLSISHLSGSGLTPNTVGLLRFGAGYKRLKMRPSAFREWWWTNSARVLNRCSAVTYSYRMQNNKDFTRESNWIPIQHLIVAKTFVWLQCIKWKLLTFSQQSFLRTPTLNLTVTVMSNFSPPFQCYLLLPQGLTTSSGTTSKSYESLKLSLKKQNLLTLPSASSLIL